MRQQVPPSMPCHTRQTHILAGLLTCLLVSLSSVSRAADRPNILWISCEDIGPHLGCYGHDRAITPTLDRLARRGVRYTRALTTCPVCATNRSSIITAMYPSTIGTHYMRCTAKLPDEIRCFTEYLRQAGYYCTNNSKTDYNFDHPVSAWDESSGRANWRGRRKGQPFFAVHNFTNTHESRIWPRGGAHLKQTKDLKPQERQDPDRLQLPPYYPDTPAVRRDWANYFENITQLDYHVADLLQQLAADGLADDTIIFFWSDHGVGLPRGKRWLYDSGTRVPLIVVIPEKFRTGGQGSPDTTSDELVCTLDLGPTVLNLAGVEVPGHMQGRAFLGPNRPPSRQCVFGVRDRMDERYDMIRTVRDERYRYIRNYMPWKPYTQYLNYGERNETMKALRRCHANGTLPPAARLFMADRKPIEELYDTHNDPHEIHNLAESPAVEHRLALERLRAAHSRWSSETSDLGLVPEPIVAEGEREYGNRSAIFGQSGGDSLLAQITEVLLTPTIAPEVHVRCCQTGVQAPSAAVRYWAVLGLSDRGRGATVADPIRDRCIQSLAPLLDDPAPVVRVAAADGLCQLGAVVHALPVLIQQLEQGGPWIRLQAAIALDELDERARPAAADLEKALNDKQNPYVARVAERALQTLRGREPRDL